MGRRAGRRAASAAVFALACAATPAAAAGFTLMSPDTEVTTTVGVDTISVFRGVRSRRLNPNPQVFVDYARERLYAGLYAAPVAFGPETDLLLTPYAGVTPRVGSVDFDIGAGAYLFPGGRPFVYDVPGRPPQSGHKRLVEPYAGVKRAFGSAELSGFVFYTPDTIGEAGPAWYGRAQVEADLPFALEAGANFGVSRYRDVELNPDYEDYSAWLGREVRGFDLRLTWSDALRLPGPSNAVLSFRIERQFTLRRTHKDYMDRKISNRFVIDKSRLRF